jgi:hypothetical protein
VKHRFLLDENILYFAIFAVDERDLPDTTSTELVRRIGANCHRIVINASLAERYWSHINGMLRSGTRATATEAVRFINELLKNSEKLWREYDECPELPAGVQVPAEDVHIVRLALLAQTKIITGDADLREAVNGAPALKLEALTPREALDLAADS